MYRNKLFTGIMPALVTPVNEDGTLKEACVRSLIDWQLNQGVQGFYICGHTGEGPALTEETRRRMAEVTVDQTAGRGKIICHVGAADVQSAISLTRHAHEVGCDAIASLPPTGYYGYGEDEVFTYYKALGESCPLPLMAYATGMFRQEDITPFVERLMGLPTVVGLKYTRMNYYEMRNILELNGGNINVINGPDEMLVCGLTMGADGGIGSTYNLMPRRYAALFNDFSAGDFEAARQAQFRINRVIRVLIQYGVIRSIKQTLCEMGFDAGQAVFPGRPFLRDEAQALRRALKEADFTYEM